MSFSKSWKSLDKAKALEVTLDGALKVLEITQDVLNTTPIPGAAAIITIILDVVKRQERASSNAQRTVEQQERWKKLVGQLEECEANSESTQPDVLSNLRDASRELARQLEDYARELKKATTHEFRPRWMTCGSDEEALQDFIRKSNEAIEDYNHAQVKRIEECVMKMQRVVGAMDTKVDSMIQEDKIREFDGLIEKRRAPLASYNAPRMVGTLSSCAEGTRTPLLQEVADWIKDPAADKVFWLKERAGFGKTAIALSVAEQADNEGTLAASFFFSYQIPDLSNTSRFLPTIIYQLCLFGGTPFKECFAEPITKHIGLLDAKLKHQWKKLFLDPLKNLNLAPEKAPIVIVIDALDECQHDDAQDLTTFIASLTSLELPFKVFITSRPESQITAPFSDLGVEPRAVVDTSNEDVETYLRAELAKIPSKPSIRNLHLPRDWIKEEDIQALLERAGAKGVDYYSTSAEKGLFVYVATVLRFIGDTRRCNPPKLLEIVLSATPPLSNYRPFEALDGLYIRVLYVALGGAEDLLQQFHAVVGGTMAMENTLLEIRTAETLEELLDLPRGEVRRTLINLQSVILYLDTGSTLPSFHHRSFADFLTNKDRCGSQYYINIKLHRKSLALGCMRVITTSPLKGDVINAMNKEDYVCYQKIIPSPGFLHASVIFPHYYESNPGDADTLDVLERFIRDDFGWWTELLPVLPYWTTTYPQVADAADPKDERELPVFFRGLHFTLPSKVLDGQINLYAPIRKEMRRYISAVTRQQGGESRVQTQTMITSFKEHVYEMRTILNTVNDDKEISAAVLAFAKATEATVDEYEISIGNQAEVERNRKRTTFLRNTLKPLIASTSYFDVTADELEAFEQEGVWSPKPTLKPDQTPPT